MTERRPFNFGWVIVGVCFINLGSSYGVWYSFSVFFVALIKEFGWSRSVGAGAFSLFIILHSLVGPFVGTMVDKFGPRRMMVIGSLFLLIGLFLSSLIRSWWQFYIFYGVITALGVGCTGWITNTTLIQNWFQKKRGLAIGIISSGVGVGIILCTPLVQYLINLYGWRTTYRIMALFIPFTIFSLAILFLRRPPKSELTNHQEGEVFLTTIRNSSFIDQEWSSKSWTVKEAMATKQFWLLTLSFSLGSFSTQSILTHNVAFFVDQGLEALFASYLLGMVGIISMVGKILWGTLSDRIGREVTYTMGIMSAVIGMAFLLTYSIYFNSSLPYGYAIFFGMGYAVTASLPPIITADFFEGKTFGSIFGAVMLFNGLGGACGAWFAGFIHDQLKSYQVVFIIMIGCILAAGTIIWLAAPRKIRIVPGKYPGVMMR